MTLRNLSMAALIAAFSATAVRAVPLIDGTADAEYGAAKSVQNTNTEFGDTLLGDLVADSGGSEIDQVFATVANGRLYVTIAGNLERNFNKYDVFIDSKTGGVNTIVGALLPDQVDGYCCSGNAAGDGALQRMDGMKFDTNFNADYYLTFSHGIEKVGLVTDSPNPGDRETGFWAINAAYAELINDPVNGPNGRSVRAGIQLSPLGRPGVLRFPFNSDFDADADSDGADLLTWQRNNGTGAGAVRATGDATGEGAVNSLDLDQWEGEVGTVRTLANDPYGPYNGGPPTTALLGPTLPGLTQGKLIDKTYVAANGFNGPNLIAKELEFVLAENPMDPTTLDRNRRDMENTIGLELGFNNSNAVGVQKSQDFGYPGTGNPASVKTGLEFSIPLDQIGTPGPGSTIKITAFVNNSGHDYLANQFSGVGNQAGNLGPASFVDFTPINGEQYVNVGVPMAVAASGAIPEPGTVMLLGAGLAGLGLTRRRR